MDAATQKDTAIQLIVNDLVNCKLIHGLSALNIDAGVYSLYLAAPIMTVMGIEKEQQTPELYDLYTSLCRKVVAVNFDEANQTGLQALAFEVYGVLSKCV